MTEKLKENVNVPVWVISLIVPLIITIFITVLYNGKTQASDNAVFRTSIQGITNRLDRIERIIDNQNESHAKN